LDVPRYVEGRGEQAKYKNGRKLGRSKKTKYRNTKKKIRKDKENYLREKGRELEEHSKKRKTKELHQQIREICGKPKINTGTLKSITGKEYIKKDKIIRRWKEYTEDP
jgi:hypothetical protein